MPLMKNKNFKYFAYAFAFIICLTLVFSLTRSLQNKEEDFSTPKAARIAEKILFESKKNMENEQDFGRKFEFNKTSAPVYSHGAISIVKDSSFEGVRAKPKTMMQKLQDMAKSKKSKIDPIELNDKDLKKKIFISTDVLKQAIKISRVPGLGAEQSDSKITMIKVSVDYKLFRNKETWKAFISSHKGDFPDIDFSKKNALILVSLSDFPSGIFQIVNVIQKSQQIIVKYKVNPLIMAVGSNPDTHDHYTSASIGKSDLPIVLVQVP